MEPQEDYLADITINMTDNEVTDVVRKAFGHSWKFLNELEIWTHYDNALSHREQLSLKKDLSIMLEKHEASHKSLQPAQHSSSSGSTPSLNFSPSPSPGNTPALEENADFSKEFYHALEFSTFTVAQTQYTFRNTLGQSPAPVRPIIPLSFTYNEVVDAKYIAEIAARAMMNPISVPWAYMEYVEHVGVKNTGKNKDTEAKLKKHFPPGPSFANPSKDFDSPLTITDQEGRILFWYLPDIISENAQAEWHNSLALLNEVVKSDPRNVTLPDQIHSIQTRQYHPKPREFSWRRNPTYFSPGKVLSPGITDIASVWFQAGHSNGSNLPEVSKVLKKSVSTREWLVANRRFLSITAAVLAVTHPEQFQAGVTILQRIKANPHLLREPGHFEHVLRTWCLPCTGVSIIANRETIYHRDIGGSPHWYDLLATMGHHSGTRFHLPSLNATFSYHPGTMIAIAGKLLPHSVDAVEEGDRVCFAWFMREDVREYLHIPEGTLSSLTSVMSATSFS